MNPWSWQDSLRQAATIRTLPHAWKEHVLPQQQQLDAQPPRPSEASFEKLLNACNSSPAFSSRLAPLDGVACASLPALEPLPQGAELVSVRASSDQFFPASSFRLSAAHCHPPAPSPASDAEPAAEFMRTDEAQEGQRCEWEGEWCEADEVMSPRSSTGSCCDPEDLDSLLEAPHAFSSGHEHDMVAQLHQIAAVLAESEAREGAVQGGGAAGVEVDEQLGNAIRQVLLIRLPARPFQPTLAQ
ncbi:unnamed protein product [Closterium sp. Naga37s-1]|nr:unnamed protein product [Closterium sp. Naga37s-1]